MGFLSGLGSWFVKVALDWLYKKLRLFGVWAIRHFKNRAADREENKKIKEGVENATTQAEAQAALDDAARGFNKHR